jgi:hypothetical protein
MRFHKNGFYKGNAGPCFIETKIVTDSVGGFQFFKDKNIST